MTTATLTGTDVRLRNFVVRELDWDPDVDASAIGVAAKDGVVTLTGFVDTYGEKLGAERVAKRVRASARSPTTSPSESPSIAPTQISQLTPSPRSNCRQRSRTKFRSPSIAATSH